MIDSNVLLAFFSTSVILALSPGPDNLFVMAQSAQNGRKAGLFVTLGLTTGLIGHTVAVAFGLAAIVHSSVLAFGIMKFMGRHISFISHGRRSGQQHQLFSSGHFKCFPVEVFTGEGLS